MALMTDDRENYWQSQLNSKVTKYVDSKRYKLVKEKGWNGFNKLSNIEIRVIMSGKYDLLQLEALMTHD